MLDEIYAKYGRLDEKYLAPALRQLISGKAKILRQATEPTGASAGDVWIDSAHNDLTYVYAGGWQPISVAGLNSSYITVFDDLIQIMTGGKLLIHAGAELNMTAGSGANAIGLSNNNAAGYFLWAGNADPAAAPYSVKRDGTVKATTLQVPNSQITNVTNSYAQHFLENADATYPAVFAICIPENTGSMASVKLSFKAQKFRAYSKAGVGSATGTLQTNNTTVSVLDEPHNHTIPSHGHSVSITYGIYEKATLPTSCTLKVDGNTVATYTNSPPSVSELEISSYLDKTGGIINKGWHEIEISTDDDARIVANVFIQTVVNRVIGSM